MKFLLLHGYSEKYGFESIRLKQWLTRLNEYGFSVDDYICPMPVKGMRLPWHKLDYNWKTADKHLMSFYEEFAKKCDQYDVLINFGALNLHPQFLEQLSITKILIFRDDPESSDYFSKPIALFHDICAIGNIAEIDQYIKWGHKNVFWLPNGFWIDDYDPELTEEKLFSINRDVDVSIMCERLTQYRKKNLDKYTTAFPQGKYYGKGWPSGFLPESERVNLLQRTKIGINIHNSTGPINFRTFYLPANGIMQICDNKSHLAKIFELDKEVVGYDSIEEAIDKTHHYLNNPEKRLEIAIAGYRRTINNYNEIECFKRIVEAVERFVGDNENIKTNELPLKIVGKANIIEKGSQLLKVCFSDVVFKTKNFYNHKLPRFLGKLHK
jgi:spore maturation protein CgeB